MFLKAAKYFNKFSFIFHIFLNKVTLAQLIRFLQTESLE